MKVPGYPLNPVLLVDDEPLILTGFQASLRSAGITNMMLCSDAREVMDILATNKIELILLDLIMPGMSGDELLSLITHTFPHIPVIIITGIAEVDMAVRCMQKGTFDYMVKPVENSRLISGVKKALELRGLQHENQRLKEHILSGSLKNPAAFSNILTRNRCMIGLFQYAEAIAVSGYPVLITGETGVGKELLARSIHELSGRKGPLVTVNAAGIDDNTFSDTMFGHLSGAFTGADKVRSGMVERAEGGTLFLDEIGDLTLNSQVKLLRLLQEHEYLPLGADLPKIANLKIIVATNRDLEALQASGKFRRDLFYRLCIHHLHIPPLRERMDDLPMLMTHFIENAAREFGKKTPIPPPELVRLLLNYHYPGNVRELKAMIYDGVANHQAKIMSMGRFTSYINGKLTGCRGNVPSLPPAPEHNLFAGCCSMPTLESVMDQLVSETMKRTGNNQSMAARFLGISRQRLGRYLKRVAERR